jgi:hypothetical protein
MKNLSVRRICFALAVLFAAFLAGCINYEEKIELNSNGSGTMVMHYSLSQQLSAMMAMGGQSTENKDQQFPFKLKEEEVRADLKAKGVTVKKFETKTENDQQHFYVTIAFDKITDLNQTKTFKEMPFDWKQEGGTSHFTQTLKGKKEKGASAGDQMGKQMAQAMIGNAEFKFQVKLPSKALPPPQTNGTIAEDGKTVTWKYPLLEVSENEKVMTAGFSASRFGISRMMIFGLIGAAFVSVAAFLFVLMLAKRK